MNALPIVLSAVSLAFAGLSLGWNIYRDVLLKPRLKVSVSKVLLTPAHRANSWTLKISAVNHGPGVIRLNIIRFTLAPGTGKNSKASHGVLFHDWENPLSGQLPCSLEVGEVVDFLFEWSEDNLFSKRPVRVGLRDSFDRTHWAPAKEVRLTQDDWNSEFG